MIWLTWRQFRAQAIAAGAALAATAIALIVTGPHLADLYASSGLPGCQAGCGTEAANFINQVKGSGAEIVFYGGIFLLYAAPAVIGMFWGAPLLTRELEAGTFRLAWNQSVTRSRWIAVKLGLIGLAAMATTGLLSLMTSWWAAPLYRAAHQAGPNSLSISKFEPTLFGATGVAPIGYAAFAFALGVTVGVLARRTLPAMALTLALFAAVQILTPAFVRPHLIAPAHTVEPLGKVAFNGIGDSNNGVLLMQVTSINGELGAWITSSQAVNVADQTVTAPRACAQTNTFVQCLASHGVRVAVTYQPASRYWALQWYEAGIYLVLAIGLGGICYWRIRRVS
ncbi:MAG: ABC transporter permease [Streptosporangiaceae bacterium]